jgi:hypothetical protein
MTFTKYEVKSKTRKIKGSEVQLKMSNEAVGRFGVVERYHKSRLLDREKDNCGSPNDSTSFVRIQKT